MCVQIARSYPNGEAALMARSHGSLHGGNVRVFAFGGSGERMATGAHPHSAGLKSEASIPSENSRVRICPQHPGIHVSP